MSLRARINLEYQALHGQGWYRHPDHYLRSGTVGYFVTDRQLTEITWRTISGSPPRKVVESPGTGEEFLERISIGYLMGMALHLYDLRPARPLRDPLGDTIILLYFRT